jgi:transaldolase
MQIFLDTANCQEIERWLAHGLVDGVTTNPSICVRDGVYDLEEGTRVLCRLLDPRPVSVEVTSNDPEQMVRQGRAMARWAPNVVVKVPVINQDGLSCLSVVHRLSQEGVAVNCTAILSFNQALLAAKAGASYVSLFAGRIADEGGNPSEVIRNLRGWLDRWAHPARIIVGSIRTVLDVQLAALAGAHIITIPPQFLPRMVDHKYSRETVRGFNADAERALAEFAARAADRS